MEDGNGEVNSYELVEERYGERREGNAVLVFAAEELNRNTYVKVESDATPQDQRMYGIKLNQLRKFATGIYDYSAMTTVFSVAGSHLGHHPFQAARVVHTTQEWCGQVYHRVDLTEAGWKEELRSYFLKPRGQRTASRRPRNGPGGQPLDLGAELGGRVLGPGESVEVQLYPSLWELRKTHRPFGAAPVVVKKGASVALETPAGCRRVSVVGPCPTGVDRVRRGGRCAPDRRLGGQPRGECTACRERAPAVLEDARWTQTRRGSGLGCRGLGLGSRGTSTLRVPGPQDQRPRVGRVGRGARSRYDSQRGSGLATTLDVVVNLPPPLNVVVGARTLPAGSGVRRRSGARR
ncbi:MAG: hypothetical protein R3E97_08615 [Candidatus Eisenbacteria bacterium]